MRVTFTQIFLGILFTCASYASNVTAQGVLNREISLSVEQGDIKQVLKQIQNQADVKFVYSPSAIRADRKISMNVTSKRLGEFLDQDLSALYINYKILDGKILLFNRENAEKAEGESALRVNVNGTVRSSTGESLPGVSVRIKGSTGGSSTDATGRFVLNVPDLNATLVFTYIGFTTQEVPLNGRTNISVVLQESTSNLEEVIVIGYQTVRKRDVTGANVTVSTVNAARVTGNSVAESIQGLSPGVTVRNGGAPGQNSTIEIRGVASFTTTAPLYVIDGMIADANSTINSNDVESIQVLKDASAAAIYGSRAANGVIIITTKKGKEGPARINLSARYGVQQIPKRWDVMNAREYADLKSQAFINSNMPVPANISTGFDPSIDTDWQDETIQTGGMQDYNLSASGGTQNSNYLISGSYFDNKGVVRGYDFKRGSLRINTEAQKGRLKIGENLLLSSTLSKYPVGINAFYDMPQLLPIIPVQSSAYITDDNPWGYGIGTDAATTYAINPVALNSLRKGKDTYSKAVGNAYLDFKLTNWLNYRFNTGLEVSFDAINEVRKPGAWAYKQPAATESYVQETRRRFLSTLFEHTLNFEKTFSKHSLNGVVGFSEQTVKVEDVGARRLGLSQYEGNYLTTIRSAGGAQTNSGEISNWYKTRGILGRVNYSYDDKYLFTFSNRYDMDSRFAEDYRNAYFPSVGLGWRISKEDFFKVNWISDLKLRASYGKLGIVTIGSYQYLSYLNQGPVAIFGPGQTPNNGATQARLSNADLTWEDRISRNVGLDATLLNGSVTATLDVYNTYSKNALLYIDLPRYLGNLQGNPPVNAASIRNKGVEAAITYRNNKSDFKWDVSGNFTTIKNVVESVGNQSAQKNYIQANNARTQVGRSVGEWFLIQADGLFQNQAEINNYKNSQGQIIQPNAKPGDVRYKDLNDDGKIDDEDRAFDGSPWPTLQTGLQFNASYKRFNLNLQLVGIFGYKVFNDVRRILDSYENTNFRSDINPWTPDNTNTSDPRIGTDVNDVGLSINRLTRTNRWLENASYLRLRNLEFGYNIPSGLLKQVSVSNARIYVSGQNLLTFTKYKGLDPDVVGNGIQERGQDNGNWPSSRIISFGFQCDF